MARRINRDARVKRSGQVRKDRALEDREVTQEREISDQERVDMMNALYFQHALPDLPKIPGYHTCWLTTTNPRDPVHGRVRLGYELIQARDVPGYEQSGLRGGEFDGCLSVNEMIAAKLPLHLYEAYMRELHHHQPLMAEQSLVQEAQSKQEEAKGMGGALIIAPGTVELGQDPGAPSFSEETGEV